MAETTGIGWTRSTFNPWIGCTKIAPECDACYAEEMDSRKRWDGGRTHFGVGVARYRTRESNWNQVLRWNEWAGEEKRTGILHPKSEWRGRVGFWPVFCASLADVFDNEVDQAWREDLWRLIEATPNLSWLLVTKRIGNASRMVPGAWMENGFPEHVRVMISAGRQEVADRDVTKLLSLPCHNGISYEPALGPINWCGGAYGPDWLEGWDVEAEYDRRGECQPVQVQTRNLEWIIVGGESRQGIHKPRPFDLTWARRTVEQCKARGIPVFVKQLGSLPFDSKRGLHDSRCAVLKGYPCNCPSAALDTGLIKLADRAGSDPSEWPEDLRIQEFPA